MPVLPAARRRRRSRPAIRSSLSYGSLPRKIPPSKRVNGCGMLPDVRECKQRKRSDSRAVRSRNKNTKETKGTKDTEDGPEAVCIKKGSQDLYLIDIRELVSDAPHGDEKVRIGLVGLDAAAEALDEGIDAADGHERVTAPDLREQRFAAEDDAGMRRQEVQQPEFLISQVDVAAGVPDPTPRRIDEHAMSRDWRAELVGVGARSGMYRRTVRGKGC